MTKKRTEYSDTFKAEAVAKLKENNNNVTQTAKELDIPMNTPGQSHYKKFPNSNFSRKAVF